MPYVDPLEQYSDGNENSVSGDLVEEDVPNDVGPIEIELNNDGPGLTMLQRRVHSILSKTRTILSFFDSLPQPGTMTNPINLDRSRDTWTKFFIPGI